MAQSEQLTGFSIVSLTPESTKSNKSRDRGIQIYHVTKVSGIYHVTVGNVLRFSVPLLYAESA